jgi:hypothetical protein
LDSNSSANNSSANNSSTSHRFLHLNDLRVISSSRTPLHRQVSSNNSSTSNRLFNYKGLQVISNSLNTSSSLLFLLRVNSYTWAPCSCLPASAANPQPEVGVSNTGACFPEVEAIFSERTMTL